MLAAVVGQLLILTLLLIPIGLLTLIITVVDEKSIAVALSNAIAFFRKKPIAMIILALAWLIPRAILSLELIPIPFQFTIFSLITGTIVEFTVLVLYIFNKDILTNG